MGLHSQPEFWSGNIVEQRDSKSTLDIRMSKKEIFVVTSPFDWGVLLLQETRKELCDIVVKRKLDKVHERALKLTYPYMEMRGSLMIFFFPAPSPIIMESHFVILRSPVFTRNSPEFWVRRSFQPWLLHHLMWDWSFLILRFSVSLRKVSNLYFSWFQEPIPTLMPCALLTFITICWMG